MNVYTYSEARQKFASVLDAAKRKGKVLVRRKDGSTFAITPENVRKSPLDVKGVRCSASTRDIVQAVRESRQQGDKSN